MYRILLSAALCVGLCACSTTSSTVSTSYTDLGSPSSRTYNTASRGGFSTGSISKTSDTSTSQGRTRVAAIDRAPQGSFEKAPPGALSDRSYASTRLDPTHARDLINAYRRKHGLKPLKLNAKLSTAAKDHSRDLAKWDRISHYGSDGSNPWDRVKRTGYPASLAAENVGTGQVSFDEVLRGWKESPGHNKNLLLADAKEIGIALVQDPKTEFKSFWTLVIGASM